MSDVCELPEFYRCTEVTARKPHKCCECRATIDQGERHVKATGKWDGRLSTYRQHLLCCEACELIRREFQDGECIGFGGLKSAVGEMETDMRLYRDLPQVRRLREMMRRIEKREGGTGRPVKAGQE